VQRIAILGGGISGLAAAFRLRELARERDTPIDIALYERGESVGGCVQTLRRDGLVMELGGDSLLIDKPAAASLLRRLHLEEQIVDVRPEFKGARIVHRARLHRIPPEFRLFAPRSLPALLTSGIFSPLGISRAAMEPFIPPRKDAQDESLASFVTRRFGREVLDRLAQPLIGGIYSGDPKRLGMNATLPQFLELERRYGSLIRAMQSAQTPAASPRLVGLRDGLASIVDALRAEIGDAIYTQSSVAALRREDEHWSIAFSNGSWAQADAVVCALPAHAAATALREQDSSLSDLLEGIRHNSIATVNLVYDAAATPKLPPSTGFVVPHIEGRRITAATFTTQKYPGRAPDGTAIVRAFIGGALQPELVELSENELVTIARDELSQLAGIAGAPKAAFVTRWRSLLPEYGLGHTDLVNQIEERAARIGGLGLAGSAHRGVGVPDCIQTGEAAAESVFGYIRARKERV